MVDFFTVFFAVFLAEVCKMIFERYFRGWVEKGLDTTDKVKSAALSGVDRAREYTKR